jgi:branched-chain amino acid transport system substrate-binding protein
LKPAQLAGLLLTLTILITACQEGGAAKGPTAPSGDIVIASDLAVSSLDRLGIPLEQGIRLAIAQHPTIGGFKLSYWPLDDSLAGNSSTEKALQNVARIVDDRRVLAVIGPYVSYVGYPTIPVANRANLVMISPTTSQACLTLASADCDPSSLRPTKRNNFFRIQPPDAAQGAAMARYVALELKLKRVAVITEWGPDPVISSFAKEFDLHGGKIVLQEEMDSETKDFTSFMTNARNKGAQAIYAIGDGEFDKICVAASQMPADLLFLGTDAIVNSGGTLCIAQALSRSEGMLATDPDVDITNSKDPAAMKAVSQFHQAYPTAKNLAFTFAAYDCALIVIAAIEQATIANGGRLPDRLQVLEAMTRLQFTGVTGTYSFDKNGDAISPLMSLRKVVSGKWTYMSKIDGSASP